MKKVNKKEVKILFITLVFEIKKKIVINSHLSYLRTKYKLYLKFYLVNDKGYVKYMKILGPPPYTKLCKKNWSLHFSTTNRKLPLKNNYYYFDFAINYKIHFTSFSRKI